MLTRTERKVVRAVIAAGAEKESFLIPEKSLLSACKMDKKDLPKLRKTLNSLSLDGFSTL